MAAAPTVGPDGLPDQHKLRVVGYVHGCRRTRLDGSQPLLDVPHPDVCSSPLLWRCESGCCLLATPCSNHRESRCTPCANRYRRRVSRLIESGLNSGSRQMTGHLYLLTANAPGNPGHTRWIPGRAGKHGVCGCEHSRSAGDDRWNASASHRWGLVLDRLRKVQPGLAFVRVVEVQKRGLIHLHIVLWTPDSLDAAEVQRLLLDAGFGCVMDLAPIDNPQKASRYLAKYVSKSVDDRGFVPWLRDVVDHETGEVTTSADPTFRAWSSSQNWGIRMADLRAAAQAAARRNAQRLRELEDQAGEDLQAPQPAAGNGSAPPG